MSTEQSESAPQGETHTAPGVAITQQATTPTATTSTQRVKNPKRVAAGKMVSERTRLTREQQKKLAEAYLAQNKAKAATAAPEPAPTTEGESPKCGGEKKIAASAPPNGLLLAAYSFHWSGFITNGRAQGRIRQKNTSAPAC